jgi:DNA-binding NarL/FixJ family response regulator
MMTSFVGGGAPAPRLSPQHDPSCGSHLGKLSRPRVLLADDHELILEGFRTVLGAGCEIVGTVRDGRSLVEAALALRPDTVILDISMPLLNGIDAARELRKQLPRLIVIFVTMHANPSYLRAALAAGALGYVLKTSARDDLLVAMRHALKREIYVSPGFGDGVLEDFRKQRGRKAQSPGLLTARQREILQLIAEGYTIKQMAAILNVSVQTVAYHKYETMNKLRFRSTAELIKYAIQEGLAGL